MVGLAQRPGRLPLDYTSYRPFMVSLLLAGHLLLLLVGLLLRQHLLPNQLCLHNGNLPTWLQMWLQLLTHDHHLTRENR